jgi:hypothetical protein
MTTIRLPIVLRPHQPSTLERLGAFCDGGYLVDYRDIYASDGLLSLGIAVDWSFEKDFASRNRGPIFAYDGSLSAWYLGARAVREALLLRSALTSARLVTDYMRFFTDRVKHVRSYVGTVHASYRQTRAPSISLTQALRDLRTSGSSRPFLKVDIEGSEYSILEEIMNAAESTTGLAIEFHDCGKHIDEIAAFVKQYSLRLIHLHPNSYTPIDAHGCPGALELTFSSHASKNEHIPELPHPLDRPNDGSSVQHEIQFF